MNMESECVAKFSLCMVCGVSGVTMLWRAMPSTGGSLQLMVGHTEGLEGLEMEAARMLVSWRWQINRWNC